MGWTSSSFLVRQCSKDQMFSLSDYQVPGYFFSYRNTVKISIFVHYWLILKAQTLHIDLVNITYTKKKAYVAVGLFFNKHYLMRHVDVRKIFKRRRYHFAIAILRRLLIRIRRTLFRLPQAQLVRTRRRISGKGLLRRFMYGYFIFQRKYNNMLSTFNTLLFLYVVINRRLQRYILCSYVFNLYKFRVTDRLPHIQWLRTLSFRCLDRLSQTLTQSCWTKVNTAFSIQPLQLQRLFYIRQSRMKSLMYYLNARLATVVPHNIYCHFNSLWITGGAQTFVQKINPDYYTDHIVATEEYIQNYMDAVSERLAASWLLVLFKKFKSTWYLKSLWKNFDYWQSIWKLMHQTLLFSSIYYWSTIRSVTTLKPFMLMRRALLWRIHAVRFVQSQRAYCYPYRKPPAYFFKMQYAFFFSLMLRKPVIFLVSLCRFFSLFKKHGRIFSLLRRSFDQAQFLLTRYKLPALKTMHLIVRGKFNGNLRKKERTIIYGPKIRLQEFYRPVYYGTATSQTYTGTFGFRLWYSFLTVNDEKG